ncbi:peptidoglycan-binding protein [Kitasatospora aburaviensis]
MVVDGVYGPETAAAVNSVIRAHPELGAADGVAGPRTRARITSLAAQNTSARPAGSLAPARVAPRSPRSSASSLPSAIRFPRPVSTARRPPPR